MSPGLPDPGAPRKARPWRNVAPLEVPLYVEARGNILQAAIAGAKEFANEGRIEIPMPAVLASGRKP